jgi:hypothetical protein
LSGIYNLKNFVSIQIFSVIRQLLLQIWIILNIIYYILKINILFIVLACYRITILIIVQIKLLSVRAANLAILKVIIILLIVTAYYFLHISNIVGLNIMSQCNLSWITASAAVRVLWKQMLILRHYCTFVQILLLLEIFKSHHSSNWLLLTQSSCNLKSRRVYQFILTLAWKTWIFL